MKIGIIGSGYLYKELLQSFVNYGAEISFIYKQEDFVLSEELKVFLKIHNVRVFNEISQQMNGDIILLFDYNRILDINIFRNTIVINLHSGILPKWRGLSCNAWGVINGENYLGYSIHRATNVLDDGGIYYQYKYKYDEREVFADSRPFIYSHFVENIPSICYKILAAPNDYLEFDDKSFVYCSRLRKEDGFIRDWNVSSEYLLRKFYFFAPPLGTGLRFSYNGLEYQINRISRIKEFAKSIGVPGAIVNKSNGSLWVKTSDTAISIDEISLNGKIVTNNFKIGNRL